MYVLLHTRNCKRLEAHVSWYGWVRTLIRQMPVPVVAESKSVMVVENDIDHSSELTPRTGKTIEEKASPRKRSVRIVQLVPDHQDSHIVPPTLKHVTPLKGFPSGGGGLLPPGPPSSPSPPVPKVGIWLLPPEKSPLSLYWNCCCRKEENSPWSRSCSFRAVRSTSDTMNGGLENYVYI